MKKVKVGDTFVDKEGQQYVVLSSPMDVVKYLYIANLSLNLVIRMTQEDADKFCSKLKEQDLELFNH